MCRLLSKRIILVCGFSLCLLAQAHATPAWVQGANSGFFTGSGNTESATFANPVGAGDTVCGVVDIAFSSSGSITSVTDDKSNTYTVLDTQSNVSNSFAGSFCLANITNGPSTITVTYSSDVTGYATVILAEYSGVASVSAVDVHTSAQQAGVGTGTNAVTSGNATTTANGDLIFGVAASLNGGAGSYFTSSGTGFTQRTQTIQSSSFALTTEDLVQPTAGAIAATFTASTSGLSWGTFLVALKAGASPPTGHCGSLTLDHRLGRRHGSGAGRGAGVGL
jgi:hypothetical protein